MTTEITLNHITKIEGHAKLTLGINKGHVKECRLSAVEGSRYFEGLVIGRRFFEAHEMTSRICGICSCAHVICAISAVEDAMGVKPSKLTMDLRLLLTLGERIRSHATHLYFLALPDYLGYESALAMAKKYKDEILRALRLMKAGNSIIKIIGGRDLHPVTATVGGFLKIPVQDDIENIKNILKSVKKDAIKAGELFLSLKYPNFETSGDYFSLMDSKGYSVLDGDFATKNKSYKRRDYRKFIKEYHESWSTSKFVVREDKRYMVGALSRINNNFKHLSADAKKTIKKSKFKFPSVNPFLNNAAQAIEIVHCIDHALEICKKIKLQDEKVKDIKPRAGVGIGAIEVPRGTLWHEYTIDSLGKVIKANIITPTAQNLLNIQEDIRDYVEENVNKSKKDIIMDVEKLIRAYDPCFSCSSHFLEVNWV